MVKLKYVIGLAVLLILIPLTNYILLVKLRADSIFTLNCRNDFHIVIYIEEKKLCLFEKNQCIKTYPIASGQDQWPSPIGNWRVTEKSDWGEGFGGRWLGLNVPWGNYGIHGTESEDTIGSAASHGCIRMFKKDIAELYPLVSVGTKVVIKNGNFGPFGTGFRVLRPGDRGADVLAVQKRLKALGYFKGRETGIYEDDMKNALYKFQEVHNIPLQYSITRDIYHALGLKEFE